MILIILQLVKFFLFNIPITILPKKCIDINKSGTRKEDKLLTQKELETVKLEQDIEITLKNMTYRLKKIKNGIRKTWKNRHFS